MTGRYRAEQIDFRMPVDEEETEERVTASHHRIVRIEHIQVQQPVRAEVTTPRRDARAVGEHVSKAERLEFPGSRFTGRDENRLQLRREAIPVEGFPQHPPNVACVVPVANDDP